MKFAPKHNNQAFTLAEVLAALVFLAILIPVALEGLNIASRAGEAAARKSEAGLVAESLLNNTVVTTNWNQTVQSGVVKQGLREFHYTIRNDPWTQDPAASTMRQLTAEVSYSVQGVPHSVRMSTLIDSSPPNTQTSFQQ
jgi:hypothetical protein